MKVLFSLVFSALFCLPVRADSPGDCLREGSRFQSEEGGCLYLRSGLVWSSQPKGTFSLKSAGAYCASLDEGRFTDWRLPKRGELQALAGEAEAADALSLRRFAFFWAEQAPASAQGWAVSLGDGEVAQMEAEAKHSVACVRKPADVDGDGIPDASDRCNLTPPLERREAGDRQVVSSGPRRGCLASDSILSAAEVRRIGCASETPYFRSGEGGCKHLSTGLVWSAKAPTPLTHEYAVSYCSDLKEGLYDDWRLPSAEELRRLAGALQSNQVLKFPTQAAFWSTDQTSSRRAVEGGYVHDTHFWYNVRLSDGAVGYDLMQTDRYYCCSTPRQVQSYAGPAVAHDTVCVRP